MSWPYTNSGAARNPRLPSGAPPLPPRNNGLHPAAVSSAVPPPIPPRPAGFGYQPVRKSTPSEILQQPASPPIGFEPRPGPTIRGADVQNVLSSSRPSNGVGSEWSSSSGQDGSQSYSLQPNTLGQPPSYSDISHMFPNGRIPPPPPMPIHSGLGTSPQPSLSASRPDTGVLPAALRSQSSTDGSIQRANSQGSQSEPIIQGSSRSQLSSISQASQHAPDGMQNNATTMSVQNVDYSSPGTSSITHDTESPTAHHDVVVMNDAFQTMRLANPNEVTPLNTTDKNEIGHRASSTQQSPSSVAPPVPKKEPLVTQYPPDAHSSTTNGPVKSPTGTRECIATPVTFAATWYTHPRAPDFHICMNCYEDHIRRSRFAADFRGTFRDDGEARVCRFTTPRMKESLWKTALTTGSLEGVIAYLVLRATIPNCAGQIGVKGTAGIKWYKAKNGELPPMVICQACYEDFVLLHPRFAWDHFEVTTIRHEAEHTWSCDLTVPYIYREYKVRAPMNDWQNFVASVTVRMSLKPCPGAKTVYPTNKWFTPVRGPRGLLICVTCYCDYVLLTGQEEHWQDAGDDLARDYGVSVSCFFGAQMNVKLLAGRTLETENYTQFWNGIDIACREPTCGSGMKNATWYTLRSNPSGFEICRICYVAIAESMGIEHHFIPRPGPPPAPEASLTCSFSPTIARIQMCMDKVMEMVYKQDPAPLEEFIRVYAFMPLCARDTALENAVWHGWDECTICPSCHYHFIRGTALAGTMPHHQGTRVTGQAMCEMYSPRMRELYLAACASDPPDASALLAYSLQRRAVWSATMPCVRQIVSDIRLKSARQAAMLNNSMFYTWSGNLAQNYLPLEQTSQSAATGYGLYNHMQIKGAEFGRMATALGNEIRGEPAYVADELERRWRAVE